MRDPDYTVTDNAEYGSVEIAFTDRPPYAVRQALKARRFRWHSVKRVWYGYRYTVAAMLDYLAPLYA